MERATVSLRTFRRLAVLTTVGIGVLVVAGGVVRLTGSGLGCDDWPQCNSERFVDVSSGHAAIEQVNRIFSGLIGIPTALLAIFAFRVRPRMPQLRGPALAVFGTVLANGVVGGLAVRGDLHPALVQSHFLLAMASIAFGMIAIRRSSPRDEEAIVGAGIGAGAGVAISAGVSRRTRDLAALLGALTALALVTGTIVTGTGPHAGEEDVRRFGFDISTVARVHSVGVLLAIACALALAWLLRRDGGGAQRLIGGSLSTWVFIGIVQAGVGYTQYFNGVPELLVGAHIALATALWATTVRLVDLVVVAAATTGTDGRISTRVVGAA